MDQAPGDQGVDAAEYAAMQQQNGSSLGSEAAAAAEQQHEAVPMDESAADAAAQGDEAPAAAASAAAPAAAEAAAAGGGAEGTSLQAASKPVDQLSYAAIREAAAVNQAADNAAEEAMRAVAASQTTLHLLMNPPQRQPSGMEDDAGNSTHHPSGRARRSRTSSAAYMHDPSLMGMGMYGGRPNKGLRHFSMKVCEKVESKGTTSYNEVADELVAELKDGGMDDGICYDEKNIRRRVYDAINVLMALDIIAKEKKAIIWKGFPTTRSAAQQVQRLQIEQLNAMAEVGRKAQYLSDLVEQQRALKHLLDRNSKQPEGTNTCTALHLPFILVQSKPDATVEVQISPDMQDVQFNFFNYPFEIHDDALVLRKMLEHDTAQRFQEQMMDPSFNAAAMCIDGQMLTPEQQLQIMHQQQMAMAAAAAAAAGHY